MRPWSTGTCWVDVSSIWLRERERISLNKRGFPSYHVPVLVVQLRLVKSFSFFFFWYKFHVGRCERSYI